MQHNLNPLLAAAVLKDVQRDADARRLVRSVRRNRTRPIPPVVESPAAPVAVVVESPAAAPAA